MGTPHYATPSPVTDPNTPGQQVIFNTQTGTYDPYDPVQAAQAQADQARQSQANLARRTGGPTPEELAGMWAQYPEQQAAVAARRKTSGARSPLGTSLLRGGR